MFFNEKKLFCFMWNKIKTRRRFIFFVNLINLLFFLLVWSISAIREIAKENIQKHGVFLCKIKLQLFFIHDNIYKLKSFPWKRYGKQMNQMKLNIWKVNKLTNSQSLSVCLFINDIIRITSCSRKTHWIIFLIK